MYKIPRLSRLNLGYAKFWGCSSVGRGKLLYITVGCKNRNTKNAKFWGCSSVGRAPALQAGGRQFEPDQLHQNNISRPFGRFLFFCFRETPAPQPSPSRQFEPDQFHQNIRRGLNN